MVLANNAHQLVCNVNIIQKLQNLLVPDVQMDKFSKTEVVLFTTPVQKQDNISTQKTENAVSVNNKSKVVLHVHLMPL